MRQHTKERLNDILKSQPDQGIIEFEIDTDTEASQDTQAILNYIGFSLSTRGFVYWPIMTRNRSQIMIGFRPFKHDIDTSLLASMCH
jgi:hypothetical protein